ncbi:MAG: SH3 domain-containing protein [Candidatus Promineofilum sp.]|nr:SH3 domain-containing protein [Promineifilum sp.]
MTTVLNIVLLSLAGLSALGALYFLTKGLGARSRIHRQAYSVGQVEARRTSLLNWVRAGFFFLVALIFIGIFAVRPLLSGREPAPAPTPTLPVATLAPQVTPLATEPAATLPAQTSPTVLPTSPTAAATAAPTATTAPQTATVSSGVGVWLRGAPSTTGEQLEWLLDGTTVTLLPGQETADDLLWQQVRTAAGIEGWVARDFLAVSQ